MWCVENNFIFMNISKTKQIFIMFSVSQQIIFDISSNVLSGACVESLSSGASIENAPSGAPCRKCTLWSIVQKMYLLGHLLRIYFLGYM